MSNCAVECFNEADPNTVRSKNSKPLGDLAVNLTTQILGLPAEDSKYSFTLVESSPLLYAYGLMTERYSALMLERRR